MENPVTHTCYDKLQRMYTILRKESAKPCPDYIILQSISTECLDLLKQLSSTEGNTKRANFLKVLLRSMGHINRSLNNLGENSVKSETILKDFPSSSMDYVEEHTDDSLSSITQKLPDSVETESLDHQSNCRKSAVEDTIMKSGSLTFDDVIGLKEAKRTLHEAIVIPSLFPQLFTGNRHPWKRILLYGPPGTGKTRLAHAVAGEIKSKFYSVSSSDLLSCWFGESEKLIRDLFSHARANEEPSVVFMDEIDGLCRRRNSSEEDHTRRIKTELLRQMDDTTCSMAIPGENHHNNDIIIICATNSPWEIDPAFLRRFQKRIYIPLPDEESRIAILQLHCDETSSELTEEEWRRLGTLTARFSGSDLAILANSALFEPIRDLENATHWVQTEDNKYRHCSADDENGFTSILPDIPRCLVCARHLRFEDFEKSLETNKTTVTPKDLDQFKEFTHKFGQTGQ